MSNFSLNTGLKALLSARYMLDTVGHNIANANTPGYSRQRVDLSSSLPVPIRNILIGSGVDAALVERSVNDLLAGRIMNQRTVSAGLERRYEAFGEIETLFGDLTGNGLGDLVDGFFSSVSQLSSAPEDKILRTGLVNASESMTSRFHDVARGLARSSVDAEAEIRTQVQAVNRHAEELAELNVQIAASQTGGISSNDLLDKRDVVLGKLAELVDVNTVQALNGTVRVLVAGNTLVGATRANELSVSTVSGSAELRLAGSAGKVPVTGGSIGALVEISENVAPELATRLNTLAHELIRNVNRVHSTGIPADGPFSVLSGTNRLEDFDGDGKVTDELLSNAGLPFEVVSGALWVNVTDETTGALEKTRVDISATHTTVQGFLDSLNAIPNVSADIDSAGRMRVVADAGYGFDFSRRLDTAPDAGGAFGGAAASLGAATAGPYALADGDTLDLTVDSGGTPVSFQVAFTSGDFAEISQATAEEIAAVVNADPGAQANGVVARAVADTLVLQSAGGGTVTDFTIDGGAVASALGWGGLVGAPVSGHANAVEPVIGGAYTGDTDGSFVFRPTMDGIIGTTPGLAVEVLDEGGQVVATLDVGAGYVPGTELTVSDGVTVTFGLGELSATHNDLFDVELVADSDTSDVLVALGLNGYFTGTDATDIEVRPDIVGDPGLIASSVDGAPGDGSLLLELLSVEGERLAGLEGSSLGSYHGEIVGDVGFQTATTLGALEVNGVLLRSLEGRQQAISGVNVDEELVDLVAFEQAFAAAAQYISVVNQLGDELLALL